MRVVPVCGGSGRCLRSSSVVCAVGERYVARYRGLAGVAGPPGAGWAYLGEGCAGVGSGGAPVFTVADFQRLALPAGAFTIQPPGGRVLIGVPTNVYASTEPVVLSTMSLGQRVEVEATPAVWSFDFGDGVVVGPTRDPGGPYPVLTNSHAYSAVGVFGVVVTTTYTGRFRVDGGSWQDVEGTASVTSAPVVLSVHTAQAQLVSE